MISGFGLNANIQLCLDKTPHQITALSHFRAVAAMCAADISHDQREVESLQTLKSFEMRLERMQTSTTKARQGKVKLRPLPSILSPSAQANHLDSSDSEAELEVVRPHSAQSNVLQRNAENDGAPHAGSLYLAGGAQPLSISACSSPNPTQEQAMREYHASSHDDVQEQLPTAPYETAVHEKAVEAKSETVEKTPGRQMLQENRDGSASHAPASSAWNSPRLDLPTDGHTQQSTPPACSPGPTAPNSSRVRAAGGSLLARLRFYNRQYVGSS